MTRALVAGTARRIWEEIRSGSRLLGYLEPAVNLWPLSGLLHGEADTHFPLGGWVDIDALAVEERVFSANGWHVSGTELVREIPGMPTEPEVRAYGRCGVFFRGSRGVVEEGPSFCYIQLSENAGF